MLKDITFIYYLFSYSTGITALLFSVFLYCNAESNLLKKYICVMISFLVVVAFGTISNYFPLNNSYKFTKEFFSSIMYLGPCILVFLLPSFINDLHNYPRKKKTNTVFLILSSVMLLILILSYIFDKVKIAHHIIMSALGIAALFSIASILLSFNKIKKQEIFFFMRQAAVITMILFPLFIIFDYYRVFIPEKTYIREPVIMPFLFTVLNILFIFGVLRQLKNKKQPAPEITSAFINKYRISKQEKEIIELLLGGMSYKEIMDMLFISMTTVKTHILSIYYKTGTNSKARLIDIIKKE
jgi:DNA-binding CsgD family transcriptional regulator